MSNDAAGPPRLTLYGRAGCHLGAAAERRRLPLAAEFGCALHTVDIDAALLARCDWALP